MSLLGGELMPESAGEDMPESAGGLAGGGAAGGAAGGGAEAGGSAGGAAAAAAAPAVVVPMSVFPNWNLPPSAWNACQQSQPNTSAAAKPIRKRMVSSVARWSKIQPTQVRTASSQNAAASTPETISRLPFEPGALVFGEMRGRNRMTSAARPVSSGTNIRLPQAFASE